MRLIECIPKGWIQLVQAWLLTYTVLNVRFVEINFLFDLKLDFFYHKRLILPCTICLSDRHFQLSKRDLLSYR